MKKLMLSLALAFSAVASAETDPAIVGRWASKNPAFSIPGMEIYMGMAFTEGDVAEMSSICKFADGKVIEASVSVPVKVADGNIEVTGSAEKEMKENGKSCNVSVVPGSVVYTVIDASTLRLSADGNTLDFARR